MDFEKELEAMRREGSRSWRRFGRIMDDADKAKVWDGPADSMRHWIEIKSKELGFSSSGLRRAMYMVRYQRELAAKLSSMSRSAPSLDELPVSVSAESLELLKRLGRHMSEGSYLDLAEQVLKGDVSRTQLQTRWRLVRGKNEEGLTSKTDNPQRVDLASRFVSEGGQWLGEASPDRYALFSDVVLPLRPSPLQIDFVAITREANGATALHAILIPPAITDGSYFGDCLSELWCRVHSIWTITSQPEAMTGVGWIDNETFSIRRQAAHRVPELGLELAAECIFRSRAR